MPPPNFRSQSSFSAASTPMTIYFARSHHRRMVMSALSHFLNPLTSPLSSVPAAPAAPVVVRLHARGSTATASARSRGSSLLALLTWDPCQSSAGATLYADIYLSFSSPQPHVSATQVGTHANSSTATCIRSASTALAGTHHAIGCETCNFSKASRPGILHDQIWPYQT